MLPVKRVFVSSTWLDLEPERKNIEEVLANFRETKFIGMEYFGSRDETTRRASLDEVDRCHAYVGIIGGRYGSGITHAEYERARERGLECFVYFKDDAAIDASGRDGDGAKAALLDQFKSELRGRHLVRASFTNPDELGKFVSNDLHRWLFDQYVEPLLREADRDEQSRAVASELLPAVKDLTALTALTRRALEAARLVDSTDRTAALARYGFLTDDVYDFRGLIERETQWYVGRIEIFESLRRFAEKPRSSGYFYITADAGLGKTALAAEIAVRFGAPAFFCSAAEGLTTAHQCLRHLCAELILRHDLAHDHLPDSAGKDSAFLVKLLTEALEKAKRPLWLVIDALDEADDAARGRNPLLLPASLPVNTYVVITQRPMQSRLATAAGTRLVEHVVHWDDPMQDADVEAYLQRQSERTEIRSALAAAAPPIPQEVFVRSLKRAAQGNFKYLDYLIADIVDGVPEYRPLDLSRLPAGLERYYEQFWARMDMDGMAERAWRDWQALFRPVLALLGVAAEPVTVAWIASHAGCEAAEVRARVLVPWRRFLAARGRADAETWHIVHKSFADFLQTKAALGVAAFHGRVARYYVAAPLRWNEEGGYARRHLATHLHAADDVDDLFALTGRRDWYDSQLAADPSGALFVNDVAVAWAAAERRNESALTASLTPTLLAREAGCALITATVNSLSSNLRPGLLAQLVHQQRWSPQTALAAIARNPDAGERGRALEALAPELHDEGSLLHALRMARALTTFDARGALVARLAAIGRSPEALAEAERLDSDEMRVAVLGAAAAHFDELSLQTAFERVFAVMLAEDRRQHDAGRLGPDWHVDAAAKLVGALPARLIDAAIEVVDERQVPRRSSASQLAAAVGARLAVLGDPRGLDRLRGVENEHYRARAYAIAVEHLPDGMRNDVLRVALEAAVAAVEDIPTAEDSAALATIARYAPPDLAAHALDRALEKIIAEPGLANGTALGGLVSMLDEAQLRSTIDAVNEWKDGYKRKQGLTALAVRAVDVIGAEYALALVARLGDSHDRAEALVAVLPYVAQRGHVSHALKAIREIGRDEFRPRALEAIAPFLAEANVAEALAIADDLQDRKGWVLAAGAVAEQLARLGQPDRALNLVRTIRDGADGMRTLRASLAHAAASAGDSENALALARAIDHTDRRAWAYEYLTPLLTGATLRDACADMIDAHNGSHHSNAWGTSFWSLDTERTLTKLMPRLAAEVGAEDAVTLASKIEDEVVRAKLVALAAARLPGEECERQQLAAIAALRIALESRAWRVGWVLGDIAFALEERAVREALRVLGEQSKLSQDERTIDLERLHASSARLLARLAGLGYAEEAFRGLDHVAWLRNEPDAFAQMASFMKEDRLCRLLDDTLTVLEAEWDHRRSIGLLAIARLLPVVLMDRALKAVRSLKDEKPRVDAATAIMMRCLQLESTDAALERAAAFEDDAMLGGTLIAIAGSLGAETLKRALEMTQHLPVQYWSAPVYAAVARRAAELGMQQEAWALAVRAASHGGPVIAAIAPYLDAGGISEALAHLRRQYVSAGDGAYSALSGRLAALGDLPAALALGSSLAASERSIALAQTVRNLPDPGLRVLYDGWQRALHASASRDREHAVAELGALAPLAARIGGTQLLAQLATCAGEVMTTWP